MLFKASLCVLRFFLKAYKFLLSPLLGQNCRFHPSCSVYFVQAVERLGWLKGFYCGCLRVIKCNPWYQGKDTPLPEPHTKIHF